MFVYCVKAFDFLGCLIAGSFNIHGPKSRRTEETKNQLQLDKWQCNNHNYKLTLRVTQIRSQPCCAAPRSFPAINFKWHKCHQGTPPSSHPPLPQLLLLPMLTSRSLSQSQPPTLQVNGNFDDAHNDAKQLRFIWSKLYIHIHMYIHVCFFSASIPYSTVCRTWRERERERK